MTKNFEREAFDDFYDEQKKADLLKLAERALNGEVNPFDYEIGMKKLG